ncbi:hypothetical protein [Bacillus sp. FJAT-27445]|uniref:hypothetical protein n=1 Tax=Bacillus sp. FJAT-27445 TaxID=1679166 RepID=UPI000743E0ED|nr:hypothetical protein [Bacillus sp. FJAT-27445]
MPLKNILPSEGKASVALSYSFSMPKAASENTGYDLLQWYPMVPDFANDWIIQPATLGKETYTIIPSDYQFSYEIPERYQLVTSAPDPDQRVGKGQIEANSLKELYVMLLDGHGMIKAIAADVEIRVFAPEGEQERARKALETAGETVSFFSEKLGGYPYRQLDIVLANGRKGSYPGLVLQPVTIISEDRFYVPVDIFGK